MIGLTRPVRAVRRALQRRPFGSLPELFAPWVELPRAFDEGRHRLYFHTRTFGLFLTQVFSADGGCAEVVQSYAAWLAAQQGGRLSPDTGAYCRARARLPEAELRALPGAVARRLEPDAPEPRWCGRRVKVVDGSTVRLADTPANQAAYPQPRSQKPGLGFPLLRVVLAFSLATGAVWAFESSPEAIGERTLFRRLWGALEPEDVLLTDRGFCSYADLYCLSVCGYDALMRQSARRRATRVKRLGPGDWLVTWRKSGPCPDWLHPEQWAQIPHEMVLREVTFTAQCPGFRSQTITLVTTLLDPKAYPLHALSELYLRRWRAELFLRDLKTTLGMEELRGQSPDIVRKELSMYLLAYNLVRALLLEAARAHGQNPLGVSFKSACAAVRQWAPLLAQAAPAQRSALVEAMLHTLARAAVCPRPNRREPRARKRRPKNHPLLTQPRHSYQEIPHRERYRKP